MMRPDRSGRRSPGLEAGRNRYGPDRKQRHRCPRRIVIPGFYRACTPGLVTFVMWLGAGAEEGADVAQEAMTKAWQHWEQIRHPRAWVRIVASREYVRRNTACHEDPAEEIPFHLILPAWLLMRLRCSALNGLGY